jgi:hypothetical protein
MRRRGYLGGGISATLAAQIDPHRGWCPESEVRIPFGRHFCELLDAKDAGKFELLVVFWI